MKKFLTAMALSVMTMAAPVAEAAPRSTHAIEGSADPVVCALTVVIAGRYFTIEITSKGDIYVNGELVYRCPPYDGGA